MRAIVWDRDGQLRLDENHPYPICKENWVVIKVVSAGICSTDLAIIGGEFGPPPLIPGHEIAGVVDRVGSQVVSVKPGDRVVVETAVACGHCRECESGNKHLCRESGEIGFPPYDGGYAEYVTVPENCIKFLPDNVSFDEAGIIEAALCPFGLIYRYGMKPGSTVLIQGNGVAGLSFLQTVKCLGASKIMMSVRRESAVEMAKHFGANVVINVKTEDLQTRVMEETDGLGVDLSIDTTGNSAAIEQAVKVTRSGGKTVLYGIPGTSDKMPEFPVREIILRQLTVLGGNCNQLAWEPLLSLVSSGQFNVKDMITDVFPLEEAEKALQLTKKRPDGFIKALLHVSKTKEINQ